MPPDSMEEQWDIIGLQNILASEFRVSADIQEWLKADNSLENEDVKQRVLKIVEDDYAAKVALVGKESFNRFEREVVLHVIDTNWREHLAAMDYLRQGIHLRGYAQKNPKQEYKREAFEMFQTLWHNIRYGVASILSQVQIQQHEPMEEIPEQHLAMQEVHADAPDMQDVLAGSRDGLARAAFDPNNMNDEDEQYLPEALADGGIVVHRNDPCPCGSGLKYKQCHGRLA